MSDRKVASPGGSEGAHRATGEAPGLVAQKSRRQFRMSAGRKEAAVLRLLKGESLEVLSRELRVTAAQARSRSARATSATRRSFASRRRLVI